MAEYIDINQLWQCETCFHRRSGKCSTSVWCDHGESYRPAYDKFKIADVAPVVHCKHCTRQQYCKVAQRLGDDGFCSEGVRE